MLCVCMRPSGIGGAVTPALHGLVRLPDPEEDTSLSAELAIRRAPAELRVCHTFALSVGQVAECKAHMFSAGIR